MKAYTSKAVAAWLDISERRVRQLRDEKVITEIIGEKLAARLGIDFYDKELINLASEESGLCREFFEKADEKASQGIIGGLFGMRFPFISDGAMPCTNCLSNDALFKIQSDVIRHLAANKSCVFVGRCADYILREHPRCANIFISASQEDRIARLCRIHGISEEAAAEKMNKADKKRSEYYNYYSYKTWGAAATYHLCIDSSVLGTGHSLLQSQYMPHPRSQSHPDLPERSPQWQIPEEVPRSAHSDLGIQFHHFHIYSLKDSGGMHHPAESVYTECEAFLPTRHKRNR